MRSDAPEDIEMALHGQDNYNNSQMNNKVSLLQRFKQLFSRNPATYTAVSSQDF
jgi:hypothetical protein